MIRTVARVMTYDEADFRILSLASEKRKFALELGLTLDQQLVDALERGMDHDWFRLIDVTTGIEAAPGRVMRVFRLTDVGMERLASLSKMEGVGHG